MGPWAGRPHGMSGAVAESEAKQGTGGLWGWWWLGQGGSPKYESSLVLTMRQTISQQSTYIYSFVLGYSSLQVVSKHLNRAIGGLYRAWYKF